MYNFYEILTVIGLCIAGITIIILINQLFKNS